MGFNGFRHSISQLDICSHLSNIVSNQTKRPKSSLTGILDLSLDAYQAVKLREQSSKISEIGDALAITTAANLYMLREVDSALRNLSEISWNISSHFERAEGREKFIADMRISLHTMNRTLNEIERLYESYPEFALVQMDLLADIIRERDFRVEHFSSSSLEEMRTAQEFIDRFEKTRRAMLQKLEK